MPSELIPDAVIVADDSPMMRSLLRSKLGDKFAQVHLCRNGMEAVEAARTVPATLVILDYRMEGVDGVEACRLIRQLPGYTTVPIVLLTGYKDARMERIARLAGATLVEAKPFNYQRIHPSLQMLVDASPREPGFAEGREILNCRRDVEAQTDSAKARQSEFTGRVPAFAGSRRI